MWEARPCRHDSGHILDEAYYETLLLVKQRLDDGADIGDALCNAIYMNTWTYYVDGAPHKMDCTCMLTNEGRSIYDAAFKAASAATDSVVFPM